jgi:hypothetical protein
MPLLETFPIFVALALCGLDPSRRTPPQVHDNNFNTDHVHGRGADTESYPQTGSGLMNACFDCQPIPSPPTLWLPET